MRQTWRWFGPTGEPSGALRGKRNRAAACTRLPIRSRSGHARTARLPFLPEAIRPGHGPGREVA